MISTLKNTVITTIQKFKLRVVSLKHLPVALSIFSISILLLAGDVLAQTAATNEPVDTRAIDEAICWLMYFQNGSYGALLLAVSGIGAVVGAAMGSYRAAMNCLVVGVGSWLIQPVAELMFNYWPQNCAAAMNRVPVGGLGG